MSQVDLLGPAQPHTKLDWIRALHPFTSTQPAQLSAWAVVFMCGHEFDLHLTVRAVFHILQEPR